LKNFLHQQREASNEEILDDIYSADSTLNESLEENEIKKHKTLPHPNLLTKKESRLVFSKKSLAENSSLKDLVVYLQKSITPNKRRKDNYLYSLLSLIQKSL